MDPPFGPIQWTIMAGCIVNGSSSRDSIQANDSIHIFSAGHVSDTDSHFCYIAESDCRFLITRDHR